MSSDDVPGLPPDDDPIDLEVERARRSLDEAEAWVVMDQHVTPPDVYGPYADGVAAIEAARSLGSSRHTVHPVMPEPDVTLFPGGVHLY